MSRVHTPHSGSDNLDLFTQEFWDARYRSADRIWSGNPNPHLVAHVAELVPRTALDVGCGEGADTIWLASLGWQVTAIDVSTVALVLRNPRVGIVVDDLASIDHLLRVCSKCAGTPK